MVVVEWCLLTYASARVCLRRTIVAYVRVFLAIVVLIGVSLG